MLVFIYLRKGLWLGNAAQQRGKNLFFYQKFVFQFWFINYQAAASFIFLFYIFRISRGLTPWLKNYVEQKRSTPIVLEYGLVYNIGTYFKNLPMSHTNLMGSGVIFRWRTNRSLWLRKKNYVPLVFSSQVCTIQDSIFEETLLEALTNSQDKTRKGVFTSNQVTSRYGM